MLIAIDGPAGAGKSTVARTLARELGFTYLDSGAMYRAVALAALERGGGSLPRDAAEGFAALAGSLEIDPGSESGPVLLDGRDVTAAIRTPEVSAAASVLAADGGVREALIAKQRALIAGGDWVAEGRDIGTVVAPDAELKVFLTADPRERARRRARDLGAEEETILAEQTIRDERDRTRAHSPLKAADGAVELDTTGLSVQEVVDRILSVLDARR